MQGTGKNFLRMSVPTANFSTALFTYGEQRRSLPLPVITAGGENQGTADAGVGEKHLPKSPVYLPSSAHKQGLYFAGEVLDLDALTGGFNLQIAWSTGHLAGCSV